LATLELKNIRKCFGANVALADASLAVAEGEIHALLGENGAGKTTLMNILYGLLAPDSGEMRLDGHPYQPISPQDAKCAGVGMVHQHFMLVPTLSVGENILLGESPFSRFHPAKDFTPIQERMSVLGFDLPLGAETGTLSVGELQRVEIFKALWKGARLLILDEPTAVLTPQETESLFELLTGLRREGHSILFISHKLEEIERLCDRVTLLRRGTTVGCFPVSETNRGELSRKMLGREIETIKRRKPSDSISPNQIDSGVERKAFVFACHHPNGGKLSGEWKLVLPRGQITAVLGVEGNGQQELAETLLGLASPPGTQVCQGEKPLRAGVRARIEAGFGLITEDRQRTGLVLEFSLSENFALKDISQPPWSHKGWLAPRASRIKAEELISQYDIKPPPCDHPAGALSGGNQQKVVVAREISRPHSLLVAVNPTRGLDVGACEAVHKALIADTNAGAAILLITTEIEEALALADTLHVLFKGKASSISPDRWDRETIGLAMLGIHREPSLA
jgi:simple sugar transport system ATP-binding protein